MNRTKVMVTITDTMAFWSDVVANHVFYPERATTFTRTFDVPSSWVANDKLTDEALETVFAYLYGGPAWRAGYPDGSRYVVLEAWSVLAADPSTRAERLGA